MEALDIRGDGTYLDGTYGRGGHRAGCSTGSARQEGCW
jgi:16S rRNA C1402 N4-methylase RsmH